MRQVIRNSNTSGNYNCICDPRSEEAIFQTRLPLQKWDHQQVGRPKNSIINQLMSLWQPLWTHKSHPSQTTKKERQCLYRLLRWLCLPNSSWSAKEQAVLVRVSVPKSLSKMNTGDIEGIISDSVYLGLLNILWDCIFFKNTGQLENQLLKKISKGSEFVYGSNTQRVKYAFCRWFPKSYYRSWLWKVN